MSDAYDGMKAWHFTHPGADRRKIVEEGQPCRHCNAPVRKNERVGIPAKRTPSGYYFAWWFVCTNPRCRALYMVEAAKRWFDLPSGTRAVLADHSIPFVHGPGPGDDPDDVPWYETRAEMLEAEARAKAGKAAIAR